MAIAGVEIGGARSSAEGPAGAASNGGVQFAAVHSTRAIDPKRLLRARVFFRATLRQMLFINRALIARPFSSYIWLNEKKMGV